MRDLTLPNIFSPNNDGRNDRFKLTATAADVLIDKMQIYDRWGNLVYNASGFSPQDEAMWWTGDFGGKAVPVGVYVYRIELSCDTKTIPYIGNVSVVR